jgi:hypothetical protein
VRLHDEAFVLEHRHVVADRRARHAEGVALDQGLRPDRLTRLDVVLDDGAQHGEASFVAHDPPLRRR